MPSAACQLPLLHGLLAEFRDREGSRVTTTEKIFPALATAEFVLLGMCRDEPGCQATYHLASCAERPQGRANGCACRFPSTTEAGDSISSSAWERQHAAFHLATFPSVREDFRTVRNLREAVIHAVKRERGCDYRTRYSGRVEGSTLITKTIYCGEHEWAHSFVVDTAVHTWDDPGREPWHAHILDGSAPL